MRLSWLPAALEDRAAIMDYIGDDNPVAAVELDETFEAVA
ncbi:Death on curing protein, Doc toxin [Cupriavidus basilensis]|uniref:Death on curing protein, Doc toxin n=1 Tax=Cupriavidus basilensis TaxID=68895 RepID=A0A0C4YNC7_9BURK|nr:Death on curing protein, Doc toxin [Cupriavidus basilensis]